MRALRPLFARLMVLAVLAVGIAGVSSGPVRATLRVRDAVAEVAARSDRATARRSTAARPAVRTVPRRDLRAPSVSLISADSAPACWPLARTGRDIIVCKRARLL